MRSMTLACCVVALLAGALGCARNKETGSAAVQDTVQNPAGYQGMERDTTMVPPAQQQPVDTFLQNQGVNPRADTAGYSGAERPDTGQQWKDTTGYRNQAGDSLRAPYDSAWIKDSIRMQPGNQKKDSGY